MPDRLALPVLALLAAGLVALALVWPPGQGAASTGPLGHPAQPMTMEKAEAPTPSKAATPRAGGGRATPEALRGPQPTGDRP